MKSQRTLNTIIGAWRKMDDDRRHSAVERVAEEHRVNFAEHRACIGREGVAPCCWNLHNGKGAGKPAKVAWPDKLCGFCDSVELRARCEIDLESVATDLKKMKIKLRQKALAELLSLRPFAAELAPMIAECRPGRTVRHEQLRDQAEAGDHVDRKRPRKRPACEIEG